MTKCHLLGPISIGIQLFQAIAIASALILKRHLERPQRKWSVWFMDVSKQVVGSGGIHIANVAASVGKDECVYYILNLFLDCTIGVAVIWAWLLLLERVALKFKVHLGQRGHYENSRAYLLQLLIYMIALILMKFTVWGIIGSMPWLVVVVEKLIMELEWREGVLEGAVLLGVPLILNTCQYIVVDWVLEFKGGPIVDSY